MITPFTLPSDPSITIKLREATVADAIDFADVDDSHEEALTTMFLNRVQEKETMKDSSLWTAADRRFALYWYYIHTSSDLQVPLTYDCGKCGKKKITYLQDFRKLAEKYSVLSGGNKREFDVETIKVMVAPLRGSDMEHLENLRIIIDDAYERHGKKSGAYKKAMAQMRFERFARGIVSFGDKEDIRKALTDMTPNQFNDFAELVAAKQGEMKHGLEMEILDDGRIFLVATSDPCPDCKETTLLRVSFRNSDYIPGF